MNVPTTPTAQLPQDWHTAGLGSARFAHHYSGHLFRFLFLRLLRCFTSPGRRLTMQAPELLPEGFPIQISTDLWTLAPPRGFSQLATSFFGIWRQGIPRVPLLP